MADNNKRNNSLLRWLVFVIASVAIVYFLPRNDGRRFTYEENRPWAYSLLTAPFDIPVHLDSVRAREVRDSLEANFEPIFRRNAEIGRNAVVDFNSRLRDVGGITYADRAHLTNEFKRLFDNGIVDPDIYNEIMAGRMPRAKMLNENVTVTVPTGNFLSARRAYSRMDSIFRDELLQQAISATRMSDLLEPNVTLDSTETARLHDDLLQRALAPIGVIQQGERIIDKGDIVTSRLYTVLTTYEQLAAKRGLNSGSKDYYLLGGQLLYVVLLFFSLYGFLYFFRRKYYESRTVLLMLMLVITLFTLTSFAISNVFTSGLFVAPFTIIPIVLVVFLDSRTAFFSLIVTVLLSTLVSTFPLEFIFVQFLAGAVAINSIQELSRRSQLIRTALLVFLTYIIGYTAIELMHNASFSTIQPRMFGYFGINAVFISFAYVAIFVIEKVFGFTSKVTLVELSDINNPVLRELSEECPGTFQHSMAVSNLASAAAHRIGANVQLVRAGALYHDIGKIDNPAFFTENQHGVNPHDALDPVQSARIVISHVTDGVRRADKAKLPAAITQFIREHHGKGKARYFYNTWCNRHPDQTPDEEAFTYPGPNPTTKETSILMMADAVEAASRSLNDHSPEAITALVNRIIDSQIADGLHNDSTISFRDVADIKETFVSRLRTMYHSRISYPELQKKNATE